MRVSPAQAGMIPALERMGNVRLSFPRASGDDPTYGAKKFVINKFPPRKRG